MPSDLRLELVNLKEAGTTAVVLGDGEDAARSVRLDNVGGAEALGGRLAERGYRCAPMNNYIALYKVADGQIVVCRIVHKSRDYARLL